jgi:hypothetical protein
MLTTEPIFDIFAEISNWNTKVYSHCYDYFIDFDNYFHKVWRRFHISGNVSLKLFADVLMNMFEMKKNKKRYIILPNDFIYTKKEDKVHPDVCFQNALKSKKCLIRNCTNDILIPLFKNIDNRYSVKMKTKINPKKMKIKDIMLFSGQNIWFNYGNKNIWQIKLTILNIAKETIFLPNRLPSILDGDGYGIVELNKILDEEEIYDVEDEEIEIDEVDYANGDNNNFLDYDFIWLDADGKPIPSSIKSKFEDDFTEQDKLDELFFQDMKIFKLIKKIEHFDLERKNDDLEKFR